MYDFLLTEEQKQLKYKARKYVKSIPRQLLLDMDADKVQYPTEFITGLAEQGLLGLRFPKKYGGQGMDWVTEIAVLEEIGLLSLALGCLYSLPSIVGEAINEFGTEAQKERYLKDILTGKRFVAEALTEPRGGSDFFGSTTLATKDGDHYILNGQKRFVVGAEGADMFLVYARTSTDPEVPSHQQISLFLVEKDMGVETKYVYGLMGTRGGGAGRLLFKDMRVPKENMIGAEGDGGNIFYQMMYPERMTSAAGILGMARASIEVAAKYSTKRKAFGRSISKFQGVNFKIADALVKLDASRGITFMAAQALDVNQEEAGLCRRLVSEAKRVATEECYKAIDLSLQIMGGIGYTNVYPIEKMFRDARLASIWTGTSEIMNLIIQHEYYKDLKNGTDARDIETDAPEAFVDEEKIYE
ncbi:MAG: acyl-CoA/acyl-ACP dehydrogenase [Candidatus Heimdallarchaeota archaeon]|nr:acyl-CoA/acyl-ACP dehydrogenase [Candidatus Heimdallarchaeota archaeon]